jgi:hypothetical protein
MRLFTLARVAAEAEGIRLKVMARRQAMRGFYGVMASVFGLMLVIMLHITLYSFLIPAVGRGFAGLIVCGVDLVLLAIFGLIASRSTPSAQEREAEMISRQARAQIADTASTWAMLMPVARVMGGKGLRGALLTAAATQWVTGRGRR